MLNDKNKSKYLLGYIFIIYNLEFTWGQVKFKWGDIWWTQITTFYCHHLFYLFDLFYYIIHDNWYLIIYFSNSQVKTSNWWNLTILDEIWSKTSKISKVYWNPEDAPYLSQQTRRNIILRWIQRPLPIFEECAACNYSMRRI